MAHFCFVAGTLDDKGFLFPLALQTPHTIPINSSTVTAPAAMPPSAAPTVIIAILSQLESAEWLSPALTNTVVRIGDYM